MSSTSGEGRLWVGRSRRFAQRHLPVMHFLVDSLVWVVAIPLATWLRYDYDFGALEWSLIVPILLAIGLQEVLGIIVGQYRAKWRYGSFDELAAVTVTALCVGVAMTVILIGNDVLPRTVPLLATSYALLGHLGVRSLWRAFKSRKNRPTDDAAKRTIVIGAGDGGVQVLTTLMETPDAPLLPVAILDDDADKRDLRIRGVKVVGSTRRIAETANRFNATTALIALPSADGPALRRLTTAAEEAGLEVLLLPRVRDLFEPVQVSDIRPIRPEDLLGRQPADIDTDAIAGYVTGRRVLVTGAGGSIGSELCRQISKFDPAALLMLDRDESGLHGTQLSIEGRAMLDDPNLILADIRDGARVAEIFERYRPDVVFHTAALKHLPLLESHPDEGWKTNVQGTLNLLRAAAANDVDRFVNISTDKAANPTSVLGYTKRITERLTAWANSLGDTVFVSVRFGNVLGSNGSVLKAFEAQANNGGPLTVTHPDVTRYFMTIEEASRLTIHAGAIGEPGEVMILDMGEPVRIVEVAQHFAAQHNPPLEIVFTGLRPNEKLHEVLVSADEEGRHRHSALIDHVSVAPLEPRLTAVTAPSVDVMAALAAHDVDSARSAVPPATTART